MSQYDCLIVCCPVWASRTPPGVNQYLEELENVSGKKCAALITMGGDGNQIATTQILDALEANGMEFIDKMVIGGKAQKSGEWESMVGDFARKFQDG